VIELETIRDFADHERNLNRSAAGLNCLAVRPCAGRYSLDGLPACHATSMPDFSDTSDDRKILFFFNLENLKFYVFFI
jgi:hypothetical protein